MRHARPIFLLPFLPLAIPAENIITTGETPLPPPSYKLLRFDEDYSCLTNAANRTDWFDRVKYVPLRTNQPYWYLTFGGELRERFESVHDDNFGIRSGPDTYWLQRITLLGDLHLGERVRVFAEGIQRHVVWQASYVHFLSGSYVHQAGGGDVNYVSTTIGFLF